jgi:SAM-dependent methyltransferase
MLDAFLRQVPNEVTSALDIGCGRGIVGALLKIYREPQKTVGIDAFEPYLDFCRRVGMYTQLIKWDLKVLPLPFDKGEFDISVALEVIEHIPKLDGLHLLDELERVSRRVIVSTPNHYFVQSPYDGNIHQRHLSRWTIQDFRSRGYSVLGVGNLLILGREIRYLSYALSRITLPLPTLSSCIMAVHSGPVKQGSATVRRATN